MSTPKRIALILMTLGCVVALIVGVTMFAQSRTASPQSAPEVAKSGFKEPVKPEANSGEPQVTEPVLRGSDSNIGLTTAAENQLPGTTDWKIATMAPAHKLAGFVDKLSAPVGSWLGLNISAQAETVTIAAYRIGWYSGLGGRLIAQQDNVPVHEQPECTVINPTNTVDCSAWTPTAYLNTRNWPAGMYLIKLSTPGGLATWVPFVLESTNFKNKEIVLTSTSTWQAYNIYGGYSLYNDAQKKSENRSRKVSFKRPFIHYYGIYTDWNRGLIQWIEKQGQDLAYLGSYGMEHGAERLSGAHALISLGHDEYWSNQGRKTLDGLIAQGVNVAFLGANSLWWRIRWDEGGDAFTCYRYAEEDPVKDPDAAVNFVRGPHPDPGTRTLGSTYICLDKTPVQLQITRPNFFLYEGIPDAERRNLQDLVQGEMDAFQPQLPHPDNVEIIAHSPISCYGKPAAADITYYSAPSGAAVLNVGTFGFAGALDPEVAERRKVPAQTVNFAKKFVANVVRDFATPRLGKKYPSVSNTAQYYPAVKH